MAFVFSDDKQYIINEDSGEQLLYVHKHAKNFNKAAATEYFQKKQKNGEKMLSRYRTRLFDSIQIPQSVKDLLNFGTEAGQEKLLEAMNTGIQNGLNEALNNVPSDLIALSNAARQSFNKSGIASLDNVIKYINQGAKLVTTESNALSIILNQFDNGSINLEGLSQELKHRLSFKNEEGKIIGFNSITLNSVAKSLVNLISAANSQKLSTKAMNGYLNNIFSTGLGEGLIATGVARKMVQGADELVNELTDKILLGTRTPVQKTTTYAEDYSSLINSTFKPDVGAENFQLAITDNGDKITIQLGLSVKQYGSLDKSVSIVTNKPFIQTINGLFSDGKYYVYNTLGLLSDAQKQYREMKKAIVLSYADNFLTGTGYGQDFAQYIIINGKAYPAYDILKKVVNQTSGALSSDKDISDPIVISIEGASAIAAERYKYPGRDSKAKAWERAKAINNIISNNLTIHGSLMLQNLT